VKFNDGAVHVDEAFFHCAKCIIRSHLWQPEQWPPLADLPTLAEAMKDAASRDEDDDGLRGFVIEDIDGYGLCFGHRRHREPVRLNEYT
jgi:hypothetical protein